jgi:hypothetical protein
MLFASTKKMKIYYGRNLIKEVDFFIRG